MTDDTPISYEAAARGTPVLSSAGTPVGILSTCWKCRKSMSSTES